MKHIFRPGHSAALLGALGLHGHLAFAQATPTQPPPTSTALEASRLQEGEQLPLQANFQHPAWQRAQVFDSFVQRKPNVQNTVTYPTRLRVLFDDKYLYVGIEAHDPEKNALRAALVRHDGVTTSQDHVALFIDPRGNAQAAQYFKVNAQGSTADGVYTSADNNDDDAPDFNFDSVVRQHENGYSALLRIPFASLRYTAGSQAQWRIFVRRNIPRQQFYEITSATVPLEGLSSIGSMNALTGLVLPASTSTLAIRPALTLRHSRQKTPTSEQRDSELLAGLDVKWRATDELVIDATYKPDFSQVAIDTPQLAGNSQYAFFFPEKRPFFFESSDLLRSPTDAFYTRSMTQPQWGLRATWRSEGLSASVFAVDDKGGGLILLPDAYQTSAADQPATQILAARVQGSTPVAGLHWGAIASFRKYTGAGKNLVLGPDLTWIISDTWQLRAQALYADTSAQPDANQKLVDGKRQTGGRQYALLEYNASTRISSLQLDNISPGFRHDGGFVVQNAVRKAQARQSFGWRDWGPFNEFWINLYATHIRDRQSGLTIQRQFHPGIWFSTAANTQLELQYRGQTYTRTAANHELLRENYWYAYFASSPSVWLPKISLTLEDGKLADVVNNRILPGSRVSLSLQARPLARLELEPSFSSAWLKDRGHRSYAESVAQITGVWHIDAQHSLRGILQGTSLQREATPSSNSNYLSLTYAWRQSADNTVYLGVTRQRDNTGAKNSELFLKLQFDTEKLKSWR